jgi:hypothetical protein
MRVMRNILQNADDLKIGRIIIGGSLPFSVGSQNLIYRQRDKRLYGDRSHA